MLPGVTFIDLHICPVKAWAVLYVQEELVISFEFACGGGGGEEALVLSSIYDLGPDPSTSSTSGKPLQPALGDSRANAHHTIPRVVSSPLANIMGRGGRAFLGRGRGDQAWDWW